LSASIVGEYHAVTATVVDQAGDRPGSGVSGGRTVLVANFGDDVGAAAHLAALSSGEDGRVVVRPTPGAVDLATLGLDVLVAAGKYPGAAKTERVTAMAWEISRAWMRGRGVRDVVVDRAHRLTKPQAVALADFTAGVGASLWLVWGGRKSPADLHGALVSAGGGRVVEQIGLWEFRAQLPATAVELTARVPGGSWPVLPAGDFTTFLAACRRHLSRVEFEPVAQLYYDTAQATDAWLVTP
jgi:hypothetical protein